MKNSKNDKNNSGNANVIIIIKVFIFLAICFGGITGILSTMGKFNIILFGINPFTFLRSLPFAIRLFIVFLNYLFIISIAILPFYILIKFTLEIRSHLRRAKLKCQKCGKEDALRLYSYTINTNHIVGTFSFVGASRSSSGRAMMSDDLPDHRDFVNKCYFCGHETLWFYKEFALPDYPVENLHPLSIWAREYYMYMSATEHYMSPAYYMSAAIVEKYLYNNEIHTIQQCGKCGTRHDGVVTYAQIVSTHWQNPNTNNVSNCTYCNTGRPTRFGL